MSIEHVRRWAARCVLPLLLPSIATGCGQDAPPSQASAVSSATDATCDWYQKCDLIGPDAAFVTRDSCEAQVGAQWDRLWPASSCDGKIDSSRLDACLASIGATECGKALDAANTLLSKCPKSDVCSGG